MHRVINLFRNRSNLRISSIVILIIKTFEYENETIMHKRQALIKCRRIEKAASKEPDRCFPASIAEL